MPIAMIMGIYIQKIRPGDIRGGSIIGVVLLSLSIYAGPYVAADPMLASMFTFSKKQLALILPAYGFAASTLPVWFLLVPHDYLSNYLKIGTIAALAPEEFSLDAVNRQVMEWALAQCNNNKSSAARLLKASRKQFY